MASSIERRFALAKSGLSREAEELSRQEQQILRERFAKGSLQSGAAIKGARDVERDIASKQSSGFGRLAASQAAEEMQKKQSIAQRQFARLENEAKREYAAGEAQAGRTYQAGESQAKRQYAAGEAQAGRTYQAGESQAKRQYASQEAQAGRTYQAGESQAIRDYQAKEVSEAREARESEAKKLRDFTIDQKKLDNMLTQQDIDIKKSELEINKVISLDNLRRAREVAEKPGIQEKAEETGKELEKRVTGQFSTKPSYEVTQDRAKTTSSPSPKGEPSMLGKWQEKSTNWLQKRTGIKFG